MYYKEVANQNYVCPKCGFHIRIGVKERIALLADEGTFIEHDATLAPIDPLKFVDSKPYTKRIEEGLGMILVHNAEEEKQKEQFKKFLMIIIKNKTIT
jgi:acetyl-CoA carboxylase beta subunit